jgi:predicted amidophosphoribosyltransferase
MQPRKLPGRWRDGYALDLHTVSSIYMGDDEFGSPQYSTQRTEVGEQLFRLKYRSDHGAVGLLVEAATAWIADWKPGVDLLVPVPPSRERPVQPVRTIAEALGRRLGITVAPSAVTRTREVSELKNVYDYSERIALLTGAHAVDRMQLEGHRVLLFDDLYRSGATLNAITRVMYDDGGASEVFALTLTRTRSAR